MVRVGEVELQHITVPLDLPGVRVVSQRRTATAIEVTVVPTDAGATCPGCGRRTTKRHDARPRAKADEPLGDRRVTVIVVRRRFRCLGCDRVFTEPEAIAGPRRRLTCRLRERLGREGVDQPVAHVAARYGISPATVRRAVEAHAEALQAARPVRTVRRLGLDDFSLRRGRRYATGLHDLDARRVIDVVEGRTSADVEAALARLPAPEAVAAVSMDMSQAYRAAVQLALPHALITADKFHVIARVNDALAAVVRRLLSGRKRDDPLRKAARLVLRNRDDLDATARTRLAPVLRQWPELRRAWLLKEDLRRWYRTATATTARLELRAWQGMVAAEAPPELQALGGMLANWGEEILNHFATRVTQGVVEGKNHRAKVIQRQAYGYRNFANYRLRLLLAA